MAITTYSPIQMIDEYSTFLNIFSQKLYSEGLSTEEFSAMLKLADQWGVLCPDDDVLELPSHTMLTCDYCWSRNPSLPKPAPTAARRLCLKDKMEQSFEIIVNAEVAKGFHRGMRCRINFGDWRQRETYQVVVKSKYRLKSGDTRIKFIGSLVMRVSGIDPATVEWQSYLPTEPFLPEAKKLSQPVL